MLVITKSGEVVEGEPVSVGVAHFKKALDNGEIGCYLASHERKRVFEFVVETYDLTLRTNSNDTTVDKPISALETPVIVEESST